MYSKNSVIVNTSTSHIQHFQTDTEKNVSKSGRKSHFYGITGVLESLSAPFLVEHVFD